MLGCKNEISPPAIPCVVVDIFYGLSLFFRYFLAISLIPFSQDLGFQSLPWIPTKQQQHRISSRKWKWGVFYCYSYGIFTLLISWSSWVEFHFPEKRNVGHRTESIKFNSIPCSWTSFTRADLNNSVYVYRWLSHHINILAFLVWLLKLFLFFR